MKLATTAKLPKKISTKVNDPDNPAWTEDLLGTPVLKRGRGPQATPIKVLTSVRLDADTMPSASIRPLAICVFYRRGRILVNESHDPIKRETFYRPLGGGIEFGETSAEAVEREIQEEIGAKVIKLRLIGTLESIFTYLGAPGHEIVQVYDGQFVDQALYERPSVSGTESDGQPFEAVWKEIESFSAEKPLYPNGLLALLQSKAVLLAADA